MFYITVLLAIMGLIGTDIFVPSLPAIAANFHQAPHFTQLTISLFLTGFALSQLCYGPISDRYGRKPPLIFGVFVFIIGSVICIAATKFSGLCIGRIIQGIGVGAGLSLARVILRDHYQGTVLAIKTSQIAIFISLTPAIAPLLGGILQQQFGFHSSFIFMLCYGIVLLFLLLAFFQETIKQKDENLDLRFTLSRYSALLKNGFFMRHAIIAGFAFGATIVYVNIVPFIIQSQLKLSALDNGVAMLIAATGVSLGAYISSHLVRHVNPARLVNIGLIIFVVIGLLLTLTNYYFGTILYILVLLLFFVTMACGFIFPNAIALCFSGINYSIGTAGAIYGSMQLFTSMLINFLLNTITHQDQTILGLFYLGIGLTGLVLFFYGRLYAVSTSRNVFASE